MAVGGTLLLLGDEETFAKEVDDSNEEDGEDGRNDFEDVPPPVDIDTDDDGDAGAGSLSIVSSGSCNIGN